MKNLYKLRDELMELKKNNQVQCNLEKSNLKFDIDEFISEIDNLRLCVCPPKE